jgi:phosphate:Na+ symporter
MKELIFGFIGGTALLMYGVDKMGEGLEKASGEVMKKILSVFTGRVWSAFLVGTFLTALVQSSTAITVLTVGFVNAGLMKLPQAIGIIYGANIGTTITAQMIAISLKVNLTDVALPVLGVGFTIMYFAKNSNLKNIGKAIMGFGMMFLGLKILNSGIPFIQNNATLKYFFQNYASISIVGIILGFTATALVHSSSATTCLVIILGQAGLIDLRTAILIMLGDNVGTCITAQLASLTGNIHARRTAWAHTLYNIFGVVLVALVLPLFIDLVEFITYDIQGTKNLGLAIANSHTIFNIASAAIFLPITKYYVKFLETVIRGKKGENVAEMIYLDKLLLDTPVAALKAAISEIVRGIEITKEMLSNVIEAFYKNDIKKLDTVKDNEEIINQLQKDVTLYIVELSKRKLSDSESVMVPALINSINNIERIGDHAIDIVELVESKIEKRLAFSSEAIDDIRNLEKVLDEMFDNTVKALTENDLEKALDTIQLEGKVDFMSQQMLSSHITRLEQGKCAMESGVVYLDIINYLERIGDHIYKVSSIAADSMRNMITSESK